MEITDKYGGPPLFEPASGRLFLCLELPGVVKQPIVALARSHRKRTGITWIEPENLHLTLRFLGPRPPMIQWELEARLRGVKVEPFLLGLRGLGVFPERGPPGVLWTGVGPPDPRLFQLYGKLEKVLLDLGIEPERRRYRPHVTIARCGKSAAPNVKKIFLADGANFETAPFRVNGFALFSSELTPTGSRYTKLAEFLF